VIAECPALEEGHRLDGVFGQVICGDPARLPLVVRRFHFAADGTAGEGVFRIWRSPTPIRRLIARLMHLPRSSDAARVTLVIRRPPAGTFPQPVELWYRRFGNQAVNSVQAAKGTELIERIGRVALCFELVVTGDVLQFVHVGTRVRLGPISVRLPPALSPRVSASVGASPDRQRLQVRVRVSAAGVGPVFAYCGELAEVPAP
jgi:Domain of unknown function (DUF4166)